ncbi:MAG: hypothetical protein ABI670_11085 [Chloroflexota bacterium]
MATQTDGLSRESLGHLNYLRALMTQPRDAWEGFYQSLSPSMNFALRYQLAFSTYALAALAQRTPAYRAPYVEAITGAIEKMLRVEAWGYWRVAQQDGAPSEGGGALSSGHVAVLVSPHQRVAAGPPSDPIAQDNLQYSGHLSTMLGLYEKLSGDGRYDRPFTLLDPGSGASYRYTHSEVAARIYDQMRKNNFGGVCCEKGMAYVPCNNHALASNTLHDALHGTHYSRDNARWLQTVRDKLVLKGPALRGVFGTAYMKDLKLATPVAFNFTDAWGLAFMLPFDRPLVRKLYSKFKKRGVTQAGSEGAYIGSSTVSERMEISDVPINTGFGLVLARGIGDMALATNLHRYAVGAFDAGWDGNRYFYKGAPRTAHATALYALASAIEPGGASFTAMFNDVVDPAAQSTPYLAEVDAPGVVGVAKAEYDAQERALTFTLRQVGAPDALRAAKPVDAALTIGNIPTAVRIELDGVALGEHEYSRHGDILRLSATVSAAHDTLCVVRLT